MTEQTRTAAGMGPETVTSGAASFQDSFNIHAPGMGVSFISKIIEDPAFLEPLRSTGNSRQFVITLVTIRILKL